MAKDNNQTSADESPEVKDGTTEELKVEAPEDTAQDAEVEIGDGQSPEGSQDQDDKPKSNDQKAMAGKISALEKQRNKLATEVKQLKQQGSGNRVLRVQDLPRATISQLDARFRGNPKDYEAWRQDWVQSGGEDPGSYTELYEGQSQQTNQQPVDVDQIEQRVYQKVEANMEFKKGFQELVNEYPDMDLSKYAEGSDEFEQKSREAQAIAEMAGSLRKFNPTMGPGEAMIRAKTALSVEEAEKRAREEGELAGMAKAHAKGVGASGKPSGGQPSKDSSKTVKLTSAQKAKYDSFIKNGRTEMAKLYAKQVANQE